jgi:hypothetical protein
MALVPFYSDSYISLASSGALAVSIYHREPVLESLGHVERLLEQTVSLHSALASLSVILRTKEGPAEGIREKSVELSERFDSKSRGTAIILLAPGLSGAIFRAFMTGFFLVSRSPAPTQVFSNVFEGLHWLKAKCPDWPELQAVSADEIARLQRARE